MAGFEYSNTTKKLIAKAAVATAFSTLKHAYRAQSLIHIESSVSVFVQLSEYLASCHVAKVTKSHISQRDYEILKK